MPGTKRTNRMLKLSVAAIALFWLMSFFISGLGLQITFNSVVFGVATAILVTWGPAAIYALQRSPVAENQSIVATVTIWAVVWLQRLYSILFVTLDRPWWLMQSALPAFLAFLFAMAGVLFLSAPASVDGIPRSYYINLAVALGLGAILGGFSFYLQLTGLDLVK